VSSYHPDLTIGAVAEETGVSVAVLRAWEQRYGFPTPVRSTSGHRRYTADQIDQIRQVLRDRQGGMSLDAAIGRARSAGERLSSSIFAGLRRRWADLPVHALSKRAMLAVSHAIEDECCATADRSVLIGAFQRERFYRRSEDRWRELGRTAAVAIVFADFAATPRRSGGVIEVDLAADAPLRREWSVVCDGPDAAACLAGWELPVRPDGHRRFEAVWSVDPAVVRDAASIGLALAREGGEALDFPDARRPTADMETALRRATAVTSRVVAYLDG
jgi:DNA-binding transcriptional MerR regulator